MKSPRLCLCLIVALAGFAAFAQAEDCIYVRGKIVELQIPTTFDPAGRVMGRVVGDLKGVETSIITSLTPDPSTGTLLATTEDIFVTDNWEYIKATGKAVFSPIEGMGPGNFIDELTLTVIAGSGKFRKATGVIKITGEGAKVAPPPLGGPGETYFVLKYDGLICGVFKE